MVSESVDWVQCTGFTQPKIEFTCNMQESQSEKGSLAPSGRGFADEIMGSLNHLKDSFETFSFRHEMDLSSDILNSSPMTGNINVFSRDQKTSLQVSLPRIAKHVTKENTVVKYRQVSSTCSPEYAGSALRNFLKEISKGFADKPHCQIRFFNQKNIFVLEIYFPGLSDLNFSQKEVYLYMSFLKKTVGNRTRSELKEIAGLTRQARLVIPLAEEVVVNECNKNSKESVSKEVGLVEQAAPGGLTGPFALTETARRLGLTIPLGKDLVLNEDDKDVIEENNQCIGRWLLTFLHAIRKLHIYKCYLLFLSLVYLGYGCNADKPPDNCVNILDKNLTRDIFKGKSFHFNIPFNTSVGTLNVRYVKADHDGEMLSYTDCSELRCSPAELNANGSVVSFCVESGRIRMSAFATENLPREWWITQDGNCQRIILPMKDPVTTQYNSNAGDDVILVCNVNSPTQNYSISWYKDGSYLNITANPNKYTGGTTFISSLTIRFLTAVDDGVYVCRVTYNDGTYNNSPNINLDVQGNLLGASVNLGAVIGGPVGFFVVTGVVVVVFICCRRRKKRKGTNKMGNDTIYSEEIGADRI